jgi:outer membrane protein OmpA-like peptidoglycan-associated protein
MKAAFPLVILLYSLVVNLGAQDLTRKGTPIFVSHLSKDNKALLRRKAAPKHTIFSKVLCFKKVCRSFIGWRRNQRSLRFKGFKKGGTLPPRKEKIQAPADTVIVRSQPPAVKAELTVSEQVFILDEVLFERNSARLNEEFTYKLDSLVEILSLNRTLKVKITGHTDNTGSPAFNMRLSTDRARAVAEFLVESNIAEKRISYEGLGSSKPVASNDTDAGKSKNRRVEIALKN